MEERLRRSPEQHSSLTPDVVMVGSKDLSNGVVVTKEANIGEKNIQITGLSRIGESYSGNKKATEDGSIVLKNGDTLTAIVVDGGTQVDRLASFDEQGITGGFYIRSKVEEHGQKINPAVSIARNLRTINQQISEDVKQEHPDVVYEEHSHSVPYGSICGVRIDTRNNILEVANAGDGFVVVVSNGNPMLLTVDDVYKKDQQTFRTTRRLADEHGVTFRHAMQNRTRDERFQPIVDETFETMRRGNTGQIRRITGAPNFDVTSAVAIPLEGIESVFLFTDGAISGGIDIHTKEGLEEWFEIVRSRGLAGLDEEIKSRVESDPDFEKYPRFGNLDDLMLLEIYLK